MIFAEANLEYKNQNMMRLEQWPCSIRRNALIMQL